MGFPFKDLKEYGYTSKEMANLLKCTRCRLDLEVKCYSVNGKGNYYKSCDKCRKQIHDYYERDNIKEKSHQYYLDNKEKRKSQSKAWQQEHKDRLNEKVVCENCGAITNRCNRFRHKHTDKCKKYNTI